jgi:hypothetical protein
MKKLNRLQELAGIKVNEIRLVKPNEQSLLDFVKSMKHVIYNIISEEEEDIEGDSGISNIDHAVVEDMSNYGWEEDYMDVPSDFEVVNIVGNGDCKGIHISNYDNDFFENFGSGFYYKLLPNITYRGKPLYYEFEWC